MTLTLTGTSRPTPAPEIFIYRHPRPAPAVHAPDPILARLYQALREAGGEGMSALQLQRAYREITGKSSAAENLLQRLERAGLLVYEEASETGYDVNLFGEPCRRVTRYYALEG